MRSFLSLFDAPDLAAYSDEEYHRLVWQAKHRRGDAVWVLPFGAALVGAALWIGVAALLTFGLRTAMRSGAAPAALPLRAWVVGNGLVALIVAVAAGAAMRRVMILRSVRRLINKAGCPFCEFSLVGLRVQHGWVRCPECGQRVYLHEHRLTPDDLIPESQKRAPLPGAGPMNAYRERRGARSRATSRGGRPASRA